MIDIKLTLILMVAIGGGLVGWFGIPLAAHSVLCRAYQRSKRWWWESFHTYRAFRDKTGTTRPLARGKGEEGALGVWLEDTLVSAQRGILPHERLDALKEEGLIGVDGDVLVKGSRSEFMQQQRCSFQARWQHRFLLALLVSGTAVTLFFSGWKAGEIGAFGICVLAMIVAVVCDLKARMLPLECCFVLGLAGMIFEWLRGGMGAFGAGVACALATTMLCCGVNYWGRKRGCVPIGHGDIRCMAALCLATGFAAPFGMAVCYLAAGAFSLVGMAAGKLSLHGGIPMAPFLALWLVGGAGMLWWL